MARIYRSETRRTEAERTRRRIVEAARRLFATRGYAATSVQGIAREADVSVQTVYNSVGSKPALLAAMQELVDEAGNVAPIQRAIAASDDPQKVIALTVRLRRLLMDGAGDVVAFTHAAAGGDADVAEAYAEGKARSRAGVLRVVERLAALGALRGDLDVDAATDVAYALLHHAVWTRLVDERGWSPDRAERWYADLLSRALLER